MSPDVTDSELLVRIGEGDAEAFTTLWRRLSGPVLALGRRMLGDDAAGEDVAQETFATIWRVAATFDPERGAPSGWIFTIARNAARDVARRRRMTILEDAPDTADPGIGPDDEALRSAERFRIHVALASLNPRAREVIELAYFQGLTPVRDRGAHRRAARHRQDAHAQRARAAGRIPRTGGDAVIDHEDARLQLADLVLPGLGDPTRTAALRAHVAVCPDCRSELDDLRYVDGLVRASGPLPEPSAALEARIAAIAGPVAAAARGPPAALVPEHHHVAGRHRRAGGGDGRARGRARHR